MYFTNRAEAGRLLANKLNKYRGQDIVVYALPRGGVVTGHEIAKYLGAPLELIIARKIGHPRDPEYAIAATAENGDTLIGDDVDMESIDQDWFKSEIKRQHDESRRRRALYIHGRAPITAEGKVAILVDDGIATGLTLRMGILELRHQNPDKIVVAVPVAPGYVVKRITHDVDEVVVLDAPDDFRGSVGSYYREFLPVEDEEVIAMMHNYTNSYV